MRGENITNTYGEETLRHRRAIGWLIGAFILVVVAVFAVAAAMRPYYYSTSMPYMGGWFFFPFGFLFFIFLVFGLGRLFIWPWGWGYGRGYWHRHDEAEEILRQRFAKGEITKEQFDQMLKDLGHSR